MVPSRTNLKKNQNKLKYSAAILFCFASIFTFAQPEITFDRTVYDFDTIPYAFDGSCSFKFTNTGNQPLLITNCQTNCGCFKCDGYPTEAIAPKASGTIYLLYDTKRPGAFLKEAMITTNAKSSPSVKLNAKGFVLMKDEQLFVRKPLFFGKFISFYLLNKNDSALTYWDELDDNFYRGADYFCDLNKFEISAVVTDSLGNVLYKIPSARVRSNRVDSNFICLPYRGSMKNKNLYILIRSKLTDEVMDVEINFAKIDKYAKEDTYFRFNYIPFKKGRFVFSGKDISHWDVELAVINEANSWKNFMDEFYLKEQKKMLEANWKHNTKVLTKKCDTLILRQICDYCEGENSSYQPRKFSPTTSCICYSNNIYIPDKINQFINKHGNEIKVLIIENPSNIILKLNFKNFKKLETLSVFGNDYNCDALNTLPADLLSIPGMQNLIFKGVRFKKSEIERIGKEYPKIKFEGKIDEYMLWWDQTVDNEAKRYILENKNK